VTDPSRWYLGVSRGAVDRLLRFPTTSSSRCGTPKPEHLRVLALDGQLTRQHLLLGRHGASVQVCDLPSRGHWETTSSPNGRAPQRGVSEGRDPGGFMSPALHGVKSPARLATTSGGFSILQLRPAGEAARSSCSARGLPSPGLDSAC
jgi:hypothetical protein